MVACVMGVVFAFSFSKQLDLQRTSKFDLENKSGLFFRLIWAGISFAVLFTAVIVGRETRDILGYPQFIFIATLSAIITGLLIRNRKNPN